MVFKQLQGAALGGASHGVGAASRRRKHPRGVGPDVVVAVVVVQADQ